MIFAKCNILNKRSRALAAALTVVSATAFAYSAANLSLPVLAAEKSKVWTIDTRANKLMQEINEGQKSQELTVKEAKKLRGDLADIAHRKHLMKGDNDGKVSVADRNKIEEDLNKVSTKIQKLKLDKRVEHK